MHLPIFGTHNYLHDRIICLRGEAWSHITSLSRPRLIGVHVPPSQESERSCMYVLRGASTLELFLRFSY